MIFRFVIESKFLEERIVINKSLGILFVNHLKKTCLIFKSSYRVYNF